MTDDVAKHWPQLVALEQSLDRLASGASIPVRFRADADQVTKHRELMKHLRAGMDRNGL